jgi:hypothetical protein
MDQLAGVLDDLDLIRWPRKRSWRHPFQNNELTMFKAEEDELSDTDLTEIHEKHLERLEQQGIDISDAQSKAFEEARPLRNRGVFSKAERALTIAGWSEGVRRDI